MSTLRASYLEVVETSCVVAFKTVFVVKRFSAYLYLRVSDLIVTLNPCKQRHTLQLSGIVLYLGM